MKRERVVIVGSGPAGMAAALYTARADLKPVVIVGNQLGGQVAITHEIENYPGYIHLGGAELVDKLKEHSEHFGAEYEFDMVTDIDFSARGRRSRSKLRVKPTWQIVSLSPSVQTPVN